MSKNDLLNRGYELAYNFLLAVFPMLLFLVALLGAFASAGKLRGDLFFYLQQLLPPAGYSVIVNTLREVMKNSAGGKLTFGLLFALYAGSGGMTQLMSTLNAAYEVHEGRSWIVVRLISVALTIAMSILIIMALLLPLGGGSVRSIWALRRTEHCGAARGQNPAMDFGTNFCCDRFRRHLLLCP